MRFRHILIACALLALILAPTAAAFRWTDQTRQHPQGVVGQPYYHKYDMVGGSPPATFNIIDGSLPPGLSLSSAGVISGTPTQAGSFDFWVNATDSYTSAPMKTQEEFTIKVIGGITIDQTTLAGATVGAGYSSKFTVTGASTQAWSVASGGLPPGLTLASDGSLTGTPTTNGDFAFTVTVADGNRTASRAFTLSVRKPFVIGPLPASQGEVNRPFVLKPTATGGSESYTWSIATETPLPAGLTLVNGQTGEIGGTPTVVGSFPVKLVVADTEGRSLTTNLVLKVSAKVSIRTPKLSAKVGRPFKALFQTRGGVAAFKWTLIRVSPAAKLAFDRTTGSLTWTPKAARPLTITVRVKDALGAISTSTFVIKVKA